MMFFDHGSLGFSPNAGVCALAHEVMTKNKGVWGNGLPAPLAPPPLKFLSVTAHQGHLAVQRCIILDENQYIRTVLLFTRLRITLLITSHL